ncbi:Peptidyl-prolyl cis-trans isomerase CYP95, partial [Mucuna pruriens]
MTKKENPLTFMDVSVDGDPVERMVFEGGDFVNRNGTGGESIYGSKFPDESTMLNHDAPGLLSMAIADRDTLGSHFTISLKADHLDREHVVFGKIVQVYNVLKKIEEMGDEEGHPTVIVKIINCGEYSEGENYLAHLENNNINKSLISIDYMDHTILLDLLNVLCSGLRKKEKEKILYSSESGSSSDFDTQSLKTERGWIIQEKRRKGKLNKSSEDRRKRTKYYSSESGSSSDSDSESSETEGINSFESDSDLKTSAELDMS